MIKKLVVVLIIFTTVLSSFGYGQNIEEDILKASQNLVTLGLVTGYEDGSLRLENTITRAEFTTLVVRLICKDDEVEDNKGNTVFEDVSKEHWASGYINIAVEEGLIKGYTDGTFKPENKISHGEILTVLVRLLGYEEHVDMEKEWPLNYIAKANELGINKENIIVPNEEASRGEVFLYINNSLLVKLNKEY